MRLPLLSLLLASQGIFAMSPGQLVASLHVPSGFTVTLYANGVANARAMAWGDRGTLFVGS
ncbi:MAG: hypothetical protein ABIT64_00520 [Lysobacteraceae bacterium]